ncbi:MAG: GNAT family N-acetyltransferase [Defluviitaleaceae bacterium]|nr:GNAT family N-acetyltransferase [Defluviitaleaceae bacterium]
MDYTIIEINKNNYLMFDDMVFFRINGREKNKVDQLNSKIEKDVFTTLKNKNLTVLAAQIDNKLVGWISLVYIPKIRKTHGKGYLYIDELWVNPMYRKKGIALALMKKGEQICEKYNVIGLRLFVNIDNKEAFSLYEKCGYKNNGNGIFMEKEILE